MDIHFLYSQPVVYQFIVDSLLTTNSSLPPTLVVHVEQSGLFVCPDNNF